MTSPRWSRREFLHRSVCVAAGTGFVAACGDGGDNGAQTSSDPEVVTLRSIHSTQRNMVAIVRAQSYGAEVRDALTQAFDLLGGLGSLVNGRTVTVKVNLTGYAQWLFGRPPGETYATHDVTVAALTSVLFSAGARRVRIVESAQFLGSLEEYAAGFDWDIDGLHALGNVEFENTRNLGFGRNYSRISVPNGRLFSFFDVNHSYEDTDVMVSLAKMKNHVTAGVTLSMKNLFGITPNSLYSVDAPSESAIGYRGCLHTRSEGNVSVLPGENSGFADESAYFRIPNIIVDETAARPIDLAVIDGITAMAGGEGPWNPNLSFIAPGVLIVGLNPVATDAVAVSVMGYEDPLAAPGSAPFGFCQNHILLAHQAGLGSGDLAHVDIRGLTVADVRRPYPRTLAGCPDALGRTAAAIHPA